MESNDAPVPTQWYVDHTGQPLWAQDPGPFCIIAGGMTVQTSEDRPEYRIASFEDFPGHDITIIRVIECGTDADRKYRVDEEARRANEEKETEIHDNDSQPPEESEVQEGHPSTQQIKVSIESEEKRDSCGRQSWTKLFREAWSNTKDRFSRTNKTEGKHE